MYFDICWDTWTLWVCSFAFVCVYVCLCACKSVCVRKTVLAKFGLIDWNHSRKLEIVLGHELSYWASWKGDWRVAFIGRVGAVSECLCTRCHSAIHQSTSLKACPQHCLRGKGERKKDASCLISSLIALTDMGKVLSRIDWLIWCVSFGARAVLDINFVTLL